MSASTALGVQPSYVAVVGPAEADEDLRAEAEIAGRLLARRGCVLLTGGLGGVMAAAAAGAASAGGIAVALLPGSDRAAASGGHAVVLPTGLGEMRNALLVRSADAMVALGCSWGTLSEIALAVRTGVPVFAVRPWPLPERRVVVCRDAAEAVDRASALMRGEESGTI